MGSNDVKSELKFTRQGTYYHNAPSTGISSNLETLSCALAHRRYTTGAAISYSRTTAGRNHEIFRVRFTLKMVAYGFGETETLRLAPQQSIEIISIEENGSILRPRSAESRPCGSINEGTDHDPLVGRWS